MSTSIFIFSDFSNFNCWHVLTRGGAMFFFYLLTEINKNLRLLQQENDPTWCREVLFTRRNLRSSGQKTVQIEGCFPSEPKICKTDKQNWQWASATVDFHQIGSTTSKKNRVHRVAGLHLIFKILDETPLGTSQKNRSAMAYILISFIFVVNYDDIANAIHI